MIIRIKASNPYAFVLLSVYTSLLCAACFLLLFKKQIRLTEELLSYTPPLPAIMCGAGLGVMLILFEAYVEESSIQRYNADYRPYEY